MLNHPQTPFTSGGNLSLVSNGLISSDAHYSADGSFSILNLANGVSNFISLYDPIIYADGDVTFGDYTGPSLLIETTGSITTGTITINGIDPAISSQPVLILRAGTVVDAGKVTLAQGNTQTTSETTFNTSGEVSSLGILDVGNILIDADGVGGPVILEAAGDIQAESITSNGGTIYLNSSSGGINTSTGIVNSTAASGDSGAIAFQAETNIITGGLNTANSNEDAGDITLFSATGFIDTSAGIVDAASGSGNGGEVLFYAANSNISAGELNTSSLTGDGGNVTVYTGSDLNALNINTSGATAGEINLSSTGGSISTREGILNAASTSGEGSAISLHALGKVATGDIVSNGGNISLTSTEGDIDTTAGTLNSTINGGNDGAITLYGFGDITTANITSNAGAISFTTTRGDINTTAGTLDSTSAAAINLEAVGDIATGSIYSHGGEISLTNVGIDVIQGEPDNPEIVRQRGVINTSFGQLNSTNNAGEGGDITLSGGSLIVGDVISDGGNIRIVGSPIEIKDGTLNSSSDTRIGGDITVKGFDITTGDIISDGGDIEVESGSTLTTGTEDSTSTKAQPGQVTITAASNDQFILGSPPPIPSEPPSVLALFSPTINSPVIAPPLPSLLLPPTDLGVAPPLTPEPSPILGVPNPLTPEPSPILSLVSPVIEPPASDSPTAVNPSNPVNDSPQVGNPQADDAQVDNPQATENEQPLARLAVAIEECLAEERSQIQGSSLSDIPRDYTTQIACYQKNLTYARELGDRSREEYALNNLGVTYYALGDYAKAIEYHQQRLTLAQSRQDSLGQGQALNGLGAAYGAIGNYDKAIEYYQQSLELAQLMKSSELEGSTLSNLGLIYYAQKDYAKAVEYQQQSLDLAKQLQDRRGERQALGNLGLAYYALTDYDKAIEYQQQSLALARQLQDRIGEGRALENLGLAYYALEDYTQAVEYQRQSLAIAKQISDRHAEGRTLNNLGDALYKAGKPEEATATLMSAIQIWESLRSNLGSDDLNKVSIFETQETTYSTLQEILVAQNQLNSALEITERGRARAFAELLAKRLQVNTLQIEGSNPNLQPPNLQPPTSQPPNLQPPNLQPSTLQLPNIEQIQQIAQAQNSTLVSYSIIQQVVETEGARQLQDSELYIWVIQPTGEITFRRSNLKSLQQETTSLSDLVVSAPCSTLRCAARQRRSQPQESTAVVTSNRFQDPQLRRLHQLLIEPIADLLTTNPETHVTFIPHESLFLVPFTALQDATGKYLIEQHTILTAPSIQALALTRQQRQRVSSQGVVVVGNPTMPSFPSRIGQPPQQLLPLPNAEVEAKEIARILNTQALTGAQATKAAVVQQMSGARIVHLATHGLLDDIEGLGVPGAIALAPTGNDNGLLTASEIFNLKLNTELVVLSACDTGRGRITSGDGVIGLSRSLISAGVPSVIVSLWAVPDASTADLMVEFYRQFQQTPDKAQALRSAMLTMLKVYPNPIDWAAFTLIGEAE